MFSEPGLVSRNVLYMNYFRTHDYSKSKTIGVIKLIAQASTKVIFRKVYLFINVFYVAVKQKMFSLNNLSSVLFGVRKKFFGEANCFHMPLIYHLS